MGWSATCAVAVGMAAVLAGPLRAQAPETEPQRTPFAIKWGKWAAAAAAVGFTALGIQRHNDGDAAYTSLIAYCRNVPCPFAPDGRYADARAEALYQRVVTNDRAARAWLVGGQVAAVGSAALFVLELTRQHEEPNIPYSGFYVDPGTYTTRIGWRIQLK